MEEDPWCKGGKKGKNPHKIKLCQALDKLSGTLVYCPSADIRRQMMKLGGAKGLSKIAGVSDEPPPPLEEEGGTTTTTTPATTAGSEEGSRSCGETVQIRRFSNTQVLVYGRGRIMMGSFEDCPSLQ